MSEEFKPPKAPMSRPRFKKIILEFTDGQENIELDVDFGDISIDNDVMYDLQSEPFGRGLIGRLKSEFTQYITINAQRIVKDKK